MSVQGKKLWLTRDRIEGELSSLVEAWTLVPDRLEMEDGDAMWIAPLEVVDRKPTLVASWPLQEACSKFGDAVPWSSLICASVTLSAGVG